MPYNPDSSCALGCQWFPTLEGVDRMAGDLQVAGALLESTATETVHIVHVGLTGNGGVDSGWEMEIYDADDLPGTTIETAIYRPGCDAVNVDAFGWDGATLSQILLFDDINDSTLTPSTYQGRAVADDDWVAPIFGTGAEYSFRVNGIDGSLTGRNITRVRLRAKVAEIVIEAMVEGATFTPFLECAGQRAYGDPRTFAGEPGLGEAWGLTFDWWANPFTGASWKPQDLHRFDCDFGASDCSAGWIIKPTGTSNNTAAILQGYLQIESLDETDKRVAVGTLTDPDGQVGWHSFDVTAPDGTANWSKVNGTTYLFVFRRRVGTGFADWRYLTDPNGETHPPTWTRVTPTVYPSTLTLAAAGDDRGGMYAILLELAASAVSADSQPYLSINDDGGPGANFQHDWTKVNTDQGVIQEFTTVGALSYGVIRFLVCWEVAAPPNPLLVRVKRRSSSAQVGTTLEVNALDISPPRARFQVYEAEIPGGPVALLAATQYFVEFSSAAPAGEGWRVQVLSTLIDTEPGGPPVAAYGRTFGGTTDRAQVGGAEYSSLDVAVTVHTFPPRPTTCAALIVPSGECFDEARVTWDATDVAAAGCGEFVAYEIDRNDGEGWERIGRLTDEDAVLFVDVEGRRGVNTQYRVRTRRDDQSFSLWRVSNGVTRSVSCCGFVLASNEARDWSLWVTDVGPDRSWDLPDRRRYQFLAGRDFGVGFGEIEERGAQFTFTALVAAQGADGGTPELSVAGIDNFDALRWLLADSKDPDLGTKLALSYVAVLDEKGNRWLADVSVLDLKSEGEGGAHVATVRVRPTTDTPSVVDDGGDVGS